MTAVREIESGDVHALVDEFDERLDLPARWTECAYYLGLSFFWVPLFKNLIV